jgi:quercetin dioxygenase-like cupin family protein
MRRIGIVLVLALGFAVGLQAQNPTHQFVTGADLHWTPIAIPNVDMAVLSGNPTTNGPFVIRLRATKPARIPPHWHPTDEHLTVIAGTPSLGMGNHFVASALHPLHPGDYVQMPEETRHFAQFPAGTEVQLHGDGPFIINWVDPAAIKALKPNDVDSNSERTKMKAQQDKK